MANPFEAGARPWYRKTLAKLLANTTSLGSGELVVDVRGYV
ncbi:hypothetical protein SAMN05444374_1083 [Rhodococcoides kroppenstedtii]|uniref:Uncharacterized protein n=1 Tax=Rhodococcoides kroppenstedtii TaxID=293050 RepID=A0A1I0TMK9_9NOCA|nr:hypothetical protein [Rhodococcus kroppenstedtii]SFA53031.1 hypothetical protein SAMN05444374_1083 [Rhodococcus kroppenstedtii]